MNPAKGAIDDRVMVRCGVAPPLPPIVPPAHPGAYRRLFQWLAIEVGAMLLALEGYHISYRSGAALICCVIVAKFLLNQDAC